MIILYYTIFPFLGHCELPKDASKTTTTTIPEPEDPSPKNLRDQISGQAIKSGIVRIWQSWRSSDKTDGPSFTLKRGVSIQPIEVRGGRDTLIEGKPKHISHRPKVENNVKFPLHMECLVLF